jgi:hypothetical protein
MLDDMEAVLEQNVVASGIPCYPWSQRDPRWGDDLLGLATNRKYTLAQYGCLLTDMASATTMTPGELNKWLAERKAFADNGEGQFNKIILDSFVPLGFRLGKDMLCLKVVAHIPEAAKCLATGGMIIAGVSHNGVTDSVQHYVRVVELTPDGKDATIMDPLRNPGDEIVHGVAQYANRWGSDPAHVFLRVMFYEAVKS